MGRDINRHHYCAQEVTAALDRDVVQALLSLVELRSRHPAFGGSFSHRVLASSGLELTWRSGDHTATLEVDVAPDAPMFRLRFSSGGAETTLDSVAALAAAHTRDPRTVRTPTSRRA